MAVMYPENCPSSATASERRVFDFLKRTLPDDEFVVWYEASIQGRYPDFTILGSRFGLLILEVKGWTHGMIRSADPDHVTLSTKRKGDDRTANRTHPIRQARDDARRAVDRLARELLLCQEWGSHRGKLAFPWGYGALLTEIARSKLPPEFAQVFPPHQVLDREDFEALTASHNPRTCLDRLRGMFPAWFDFPALTKDQIKTIRGVFYPEAVVRARKATPESLPSGQMLLPGTRVLDVLDREQDEVVRSLGKGHRILFGVAGSGKTAMLLSRVRTLVDGDPSSRILVLCYNTTLAAWLRVRLAEFGEESMRAVEVRTFRDWVRARCPSYRRPTDAPFEEKERLEGEALVRETAAWSDDRKYDAILIDEGADFRPEWFTACVQALRGGSEGDLLIAVDGAQSVYKRPRAFTWKSVGVMASGRSRQLGTNYRNTKEIIVFAWMVCQQHLKPEESEISIRVLPNKAKRTGPRPLFRACDGVRAETESVVRAVHHLRDLGLSPEEIVVVYARWQDDRVPRLETALRKHFGDVSSSRTQREEFLQRSGIRLSTIHSAKGLEFPGVIVTGIDQLPHPEYGDLVEESNLLYVALTRSTEHLIVTWSAPGFFTDRVVRSERADPLVF